MIISQIIGGLGNQLFQYAAGRALSCRLGVEFYLDTSLFSNYSLHNGYELDNIFDIKVKQASKVNIVDILGFRSISPLRKILTHPRASLIGFKPIVFEPHLSYWSGIEDINTDAYLIGYWQSEKYFNDIADIIRADLSFKFGMSIENMSIASDMDKFDSVGVHVRRGDYVSNKKSFAAHGVCSISYYENAIEEISKELNNPKLFIFSDDIVWAKNNLRLTLPHQFVNNNSGCQSFNDMRLMSLCNHHIIANSSFSWWGAWLNPSKTKKVIAPKSWFSDCRLINDDIYPSEWIII